MKCRLLFLVAGLLLFAESVSAEIIKVCVEPFPPLINENGTGYSITLLKEIEKITDLSFDIIVVPYSRAKRQLENNEADLIGHTPHGKETREFYVYAQELDWSLPTISDIYAMKQEIVNREPLSSINVIGTPRGNKEFFSEFMAIPMEKFYEGKLDNLLKMMNDNRIEAFIFERASTIETLKKLKIEGVYYKKIDTIGASFAMRNDTHGQILKEKMDNTIKKLNIKHIYKNYDVYTNLPAKGMVHP